ncbi:hypothetical protein BDV12DRAFT_188914 [Aspergillus spectabilis]
MRSSVRKAKEALAHVRQFSSTVNKEQPEEPWVQRLYEHVECQIEQENQGRRLFSESAAQAHRLYRDGLPSQRRPDKDAVEELCVKGGKHSKELRELLEEPSLAKLEGIVHEAQAKEWFHIVATGINKYLLDMLPTGHSYTSVLTGGITACIQATVEHQEITELLSECFGKVSDQSYKLLKAVRYASRNGYIRSHITSFYSELFRLLVFILNQWLSSGRHRFTSSFGSSFREELKSSIRRLEYHAQQLMEEQVLLMGDEAILVGSAQDSSPAHIIQSADVPGVKPALRATLPDLRGVSSTQAEQQSQSWTSQTIADSTNWMKVYLPFARTAHLMEDSSYLRTDTQARRNTLTSAFIVAIFQRLQIPIISYFCHYNQAHWRTWPLATKLLKMVYALIAQMIPLIPQDLSSDLDADQMPDFSPERIQTLTPRLDSEGLDTAKLLPNAISLLGDLLPLGPPLFTCCVDRLQILDSPESARYETNMRTLIKVLGTSRPQSPRVMKL